MVINGVSINKDERVDDLQRKNYLIIQNPKYFCFGIDSVLLSSFVSIKKNYKVLDLGTGSGIIPILMCSRQENASYIGLEIQEDVAGMAKRSIKLNSLEEKIKVVHGDIKNAKNIFKNIKFDCIVTNPPYMHINSGLLSPYDEKNIARHEIHCNLENLIENSNKVLKFGGRFYMVHRTNRLVEIINTLKFYKLEPKIIRFIHPYKNKDSNIFLIEAIKGGKSMCKVQNPLIIYEDDNTYTKEIKSIYYGA